MDKVEEAGTYYRILWLLPMTVVIAYAGVKLIGRHTRIGLAAIVIVLVLGGEYLYKSQYVTRAEKSLSSSAGSDCYLRFNCTAGR